MNLASGIPATQSEKIQGQCGCPSSPWDDGWGIKQGWNPGLGTFLVFHVSVNMVGLNTGPAYPIGYCGIHRDPKGLSWSRGVFSAMGELRTVEDGPWNNLMKAGLQGR